MEKLQVDIKPQLTPNSVAVIGATRKTGKGGFNPVEVMLDFGFQGKIYPVNPFAEEILGLKCYKDVKDIRDPVDLAVISAPRERVPGIAMDCAAMGIRGLVVIPQGFADAGAEGRVLQDELTRISRERGIRILGPNTLGVLNAFSGFITSFMPHRREKAPVGVICQSGLLFVGAAVFTGVIGKGIDVANGCDVDFAECLEYFGEDPDLKVIFVHMEGVRGGRRFLEAARRVTRIKPVIVYKTARTQSGARAAVSHSGSMAGRYEVYDAAFRQSGITPAGSPEEILDYTKAFLQLPSMKGNRVGLITFTGAGGIIGVDALEANGLRPAELSPDVIAAVKELSPEWMPIQNPVDIWPALMKYGMARVYTTALRKMLRDPAVDGVICIAIAPELPENAFLDITGIIGEQAAEMKEKPVAAWLYGPNQPAVSQRLDGGGHAAAFPSLPRAARALAALHERHRYLESLDR